MVFRHVGQAAFGLLTSGDLPTLALVSQSARITGVSHHAQPSLTLLLYFVVIYFWIWNYLAIDCMDQSYEVLKFAINITGF